MERTSTSALLAVGDVLAITIFVVAGEVSHGLHPIAGADRVLYVIWPFLLGWAGIAIAGRLYTTDAIRTVRRAVLWTTPAWGGAVVVALAIRSLSWYEGGAAPTFALVAFAVGGALVAGWRVLATWLLG